MKQSIWKILAALAATVALGVQADPPPEKKKNLGKDKDFDKPEVHRHHDEVGVDLTAGFGDFGLDYDRARRIANEHGAIGYKPLPPGIRKNLARGKPLPPGIEKTRLPDGVLRSYPVIDGYDYRVAGTDLLLVEAGSQIVTDILVDVFN